MGFDKEHFLEYIKNEKKLNSSVVDLYRLYKTYNSVKYVLEKNKEGKQIINRLEDDIYTIDSVILDDKERIKIELSNISDILDDLEDEELRKKVYFEFNKLKTEFEELDLSDSSILFYIKKKISLLQAIIGIRNTFLLASYDAFLEIYRNINVKNDNYKLEDDFKNEYIEEKLKNKNVR